MRLGMSATLMIVTALGIGSGIEGCGFTQYKDPSTATTPPSAKVVTPANASTPTSQTGTGSGAATVTFTQVNAQILQPKCLGCHSSGSSPDFSTYASFATNTQWIVAGNASASSVYNAVQSGSMPRGGTALTSAQLTLLSEWIQAGALNN